MSKPYFERPKDDLFILILMNRASGEVASLLLLSCTRIAAKRLYISYQPSRDPANSCVGEEKLELKRSRKTWFLRNRDTYRAPNHDLTPFEREEK